jgi:hypothetical protein
VPAFGDEHKELALVTPDEAVALNMPEGYRTAICLAVDGGACPHSPVIGLVRLDL